MYSSHRSTFQNELIITWSFIVKLNVLWTKFAFVCVKEIYGSNHLKAQHLNKNPWAINVKLIWLFNFVWAFKVCKIYKNILYIITIPLMFLSFCGHCSYLKPTQLFTCPTIYSNLWVKLLTWVIHFDEQQHVVMVITTSA